MTVIYNNRHKRADEHLYMVEYRDRDTLLAESDVVLVMAPLTPETYHMFDKEAFKKMKNDALFVNVGRGKIVDTDALVWALNEGEIDYAALDVTDPEPLPLIIRFCRPVKCWWYRTLAPSQTVPVVTWLCLRPITLFWACRENRLKHA